MRSNIFRTDPVTIPITTLVEVFKKNMDGIGPFTLYIENTDVAAILVVKDQWGSPNSSIVYKATVAGVGGNSKRVQVLQHATNPRHMAVAVNVNDVTYTFGSQVLAHEAVTFIIAEGNQGGVTAELQNPYSGGYAPVGFLAALTNLAGGVDSTVTGVVAIEQAPTINGPWTAILGEDRSVAGATSHDLVAAPATIAADTQVIRFFPAGSVGYFRLNVTGGAAATRIIATCVAERRV